MKNSKHLITIWASLRVTYLNHLHKYEDSYALSQEFYEWTTSVNSNSDRFEASLLAVPDFNKGNRTI